MVDTLLDQKLIITHQIIYYLLYHFNLIVYFQYVLHLEKQGVNLNDDLINQNKRYILVTFGPLGELV